MTKPTAGNIDSFCSKLGQSNLKGQVKIPCEHKCHTKYGSGSRSGHQRSRKFTRIKNIFLCGTWFIFTFESRIQKLRPFCNLTQCKSTAEKGRVTPRLHEIKSSNCFFDKKLVFEPVRCQVSKKCHFISIRCLQMLKIKVWKMTSSTNMVFGPFLGQKYISTWNLACQMSRHGSITYCTFLIRKNLDFGKS